jgi:hypothetical protein
MRTAHPPYAVDLIFAAELGTESPVYLLLLFLILSGFSVYMHHRAAFCGVVHGQACIGTRLGASHGCAGSRAAVHGRARMCATMHTSESVCVCQMTVQSCL